MSLINCEVSLTLTWSNNYEITDKTTRDADPKANPPIPEIRAPTGTIFDVKPRKL